MRQGRATGLIPTDLRLAPLLRVNVLLANLIGLLLNYCVTIFRARTALIRSPREGAYRKVIRSNDRLHARVFPTNDSITQPNDDTMTLFTDGTQANRRRSTLIEIRTTLAVMSNINVRSTMNVRVLNDHARNNEAKRHLTVPRQHTITRVQLEDVRPPNVSARLVLNVRVLVRLSPRRLSNSNVMNVVRKTTRARPIISVVLSDLIVRPTLNVRFPMVLRNVVRLQPGQGRRSSVRNICTIRRHLEIQVSYHLGLITSP